ncbi:hypothetical protein APA_2079 [Pseudanabaena sp. lw0831]|nr:hypothetical protein APA_2079 [Pseudanabaena sp. lw0831]
MLPLIITWRNKKKSVIKVLLSPVLLQRFALKPEQKEVICLHV